MGLISMALMMQLSYHVKCIFWVMLVYVTPFYSNIMASKGAGIRESNSQTVRQTDKCRIGHIRSFMLCGKCIKWQNTKIQFDDSFYTYSPLLFPLTWFPRLHVNICWNNGCNLFRYNINRPSHMNSFHVDLRMHISSDWVASAWWEHDWAATTATATATTFMYVQNFSMKRTRSKNKFVCHIVKTIWIILGNNENAYTYIVFESNNKSGMSSLLMCQPLPKDWHMKYDDLIAPFVHHSKSEKSHDGIITKQRCWEGVARPSTARRPSSGAQSLITRKLSPKRHGKRKLKALIIWIIYRSPNRKWVNAQNK